MVFEAVQEPDDDFRKVKQFPFHEVSFDGLVLTCDLFTSLFEVFGELVNLVQEHGMNKVLSLMSEF